MKNKLFSFNKRIAKISIAFLWALVLFGALSKLFEEESVFEQISFVLIYFNVFLVVVLIFLGIYYVVYMSKLYMGTSHNLHTNKNYFDLKNKEKVVFNISLGLKSEFDIDCDFNHDSIDHLYFKYKGLEYSVLVKEYNGDILGNENDLQWKIGYRRKKDNTYFNKVTVGNPLIQNQRIIERSYEKEVKNYVIVSDKTDKSPFLRQVLHLEELYKKLKKL